MTVESVVVVVSACAIGLAAARLVLKSRGGRRGAWSWRDGGVDPDV